MSSPNPTPIEDERSKLIRSLKSEHILRVNVRNSTINYEKLADYILARDKAAPTPTTKAVDTDVTIALDADKEHLLDLAGEFKEQMHAKGHGDLWKMLYYAGVIPMMLQLFEAALGEREGRA